MKKLTMLCTLLLTLSLSACGGTSNDTDSPDKTDKPETETAPSIQETAPDTETIPETIFETEVPVVKNFTEISPANGGEIILANEEVYAWCSNYQCGVTDISPYYRLENIYYPIPATLSWSVAERPEYYRLTLSRNRDLADAEHYLVGQPSLSVDDLFVNTTYYWQVEAVYADMILRSGIYSFRTAYTPRTICVDGVTNTRDIGGVAAQEGYQVKQGMVYRTALLNNITEAGRSYLVDVLGVKTDLDLRSPGEGGAGTASPLGEDINYININGRFYLGQSGIDSAEGKAIIAEEVRVFANPDNYPIVVHCSLGRDRTGTIAFLISALLGVEKNDLIRDYEMSFFAAFGGEEVDAIMANINMTYNYIRRYRGQTYAEKAEAYLLECGITAEEIAAIRNILLEEVS